MPGSRLYNFTLKQPQFEITPFQAVAFEPKDKVNVSLLSDSFSKIEERRRAFNEKQAGLIKMFGDLSDKLVLEGPGSEEQVNWWNDFQNGYKKSLEEWSNSGDLAGALEAATNYAAEAYNDRELHARMKASEDYNKYIEDAKDRVKQGKVSQEKFDWWINKKGAYHFDTLTYTYPNYNYPTVGFSHVPIMSDNKGLYSGTPYMEALYDDLNPATFGMIAEKLINPDSSTSSWSKSTESGYHKDGSGTTKSSGKSGETQLTQITEQQIKDVQEVMEHWIPDFYNIVDQQMEFEKDRYMERMGAIYRDTYPLAYYPSENYPSEGGSGIYFEPILNEDGTKYVLGEPDEDGIVHPVLDENGDYVWADALDVPQQAVDDLKRMGSTIIGPNGNFKTKEEYYRDNVYNPVIRTALAYRQSVKRSSSQSSKLTTSYTDRGNGGGGSAGGAAGNGGAQTYQKISYFDYTTGRMVEVLVPQQQIVNSFDNP